MDTLTIVVLSISIVLVIVISIALFIILSLFKQLKQEGKDVYEKIPQIVKEQFEQEQQKIISEFETRKQAVSNSVDGLEKQLKEYKDLMHSFEKDRIEKYGNLANELKNASQSTAKLQETTNHLTDVLGNVKLRGQWGERMAEDIITASGLIEGINYKKQTQLGSSQTKPDYTFVLPDEHIINMDVKFPLDNYLNMVNAQAETDKERFEKEFVKNVKDRIKEIQNRDYINPVENTLDFVLLFIPNEQVFGLIQEKIPGLIDDALKQKVVLCSPFTLYAMLSVIRQAFENFRYEKDLKKIIRSIDQFFKIYRTFKGRFEDVGKSIEKLSATYDDINDKSFKQLEGKFKQIDSYKKGNTLIADETDDVIDLSQDEVDGDDNV